MHTIIVESLFYVKQNIYFEVQNAYVNMQQIEKRIPLLEVKVRQTLENFELADAIRAELLEKGVEIKDTREGVVWKLI